VLKSIHPALATMKVNTALGFIAAGFSLYALQPTAPGAIRRGAGLGLAALVAITGTLTIVEYAARLDLGIDQLFIQDDPNPAGTAYPGRMALTTALCFVLVGIAILHLDKRSLGRSRSPHWFAAGAHLVAMLALIGYAYGVTSLYQVRPYSTMALHTALSFWVLTLAIMAAQPAGGPLEFVVSDTVGGQIARRLLLVIPLVLFALGWLSVAGRHAGWYDDRFALAIMTLLSMIFAVLLVGWQAGPLHIADLKRRRAEADLFALNAALDRQVQERTADLEEALQQVKQLHGLLPMCAWCKRIRDDNDYWHSVERYIEHHTDARFSHGICPDCLEKLEAKVAESGLGALAAPPEAG
jgi:hypothetical protein